MVKLAEPRTKKRYNLVPRGKALYEDETRFGTRMLEKMGWTKGKGLGAREEGLKDFVHVRYKNDAEGIGYEARDDQWTQHQDSFDGLLKSLTDNTNDKTADESGPISDVENRGFGLGFSQPNEKKKLNSFKSKISGQSLEEQSKQSRARVHYKKFTRGKDLAQYSEKDLANIFGKKSFENDDDVKPDGNQVIENIEKDVETFQSSTLSVNDYFKQKMEELKNKKTSNNVNEDELMELMEVGVKKKHKKVKNIQEVSTEENSKKVKKSKKEKKQQLNTKNQKPNEHNVESIDRCLEDSFNIQKNDKHKKKRTFSTNEEILNTEAKMFKLETDNSTLQHNDFKLEDMFKILNTTNIYTISQYCAERFRFAELEGFKGANISDIRGYDVSAHVKLNIKKTAKDKERVIRLWTETEKKTIKNPYEQYTQLAREAREKNEKQPRLKTYKFAKRNAFKLVNV